MTFADITLVPVRRDRRTAYLAFSRRIAAVYREHGATRVIDYWQAEDPVSQDDFHADEISYAPGELSDLASVAGASELESVVVSITEWPSQEARDRGTAAATKDPRVLATLQEEPVFEGHRLVGGSFETAMSLPDDREVRDG